MEKDKKDKRQRRKISRREFVKWSAVAGAALISNSVIPKTIKASKKPDTLRVAYMPYPSTDVQLRYFQEWGNKHKIKIDRASISYENYVKSITAQLMLDVPEVDILWHNDDWGQLIGMYLEPLDDIPGINTKIYWKIQPDVGFDYEGKRRCLPFSVNTLHLYYRTDLSKPPRTWEEMVKTSQKLMEQKKVRWGFVGGWKYLHSWHTLFWSLWSNNGDIYLPPGERDNSKLAANGWTPGATTVEQIQTLEFWWDAIHTWKIVPAGIYNFGRSDAEPVFIAGDSAFTVNGVILWNTFNDPKKSKVVGKIDIAPYPIGPKGETNFQDVASWGWAIPKNISPERKAAAKELLSWTLNNLELQKAEWTEATTIPANKDVWEELMKKDKLFKKVGPLTMDILNGKIRYVAPSYYFKTWLEAFNVYADYCTKAMQGPKEKIKDVMAELAPKMKEIAKASV